MPQQSVKSTRGALSMPLLTYLGNHLVRRLSWRKHISSKIASMKIRAANFTGF